MHTLVRVGLQIAQITPKLEAAKDRMGSRRRRRRVCQLISDQIFLDS